MTYFVIPVIFVIAAALRLLPHKMYPNGVGVDHWAWKFDIETYRSQKKIPHEIPQYLLDERQWYPPMFLFIMGNLPPVITDRYSHLVAIFIDLIRMALLIAAAYWLSGGDFTVMAVAGLVYATTPILVSYNVQLNPRGLAALLLDMLVFVVLYGFIFRSAWWIWPAAFLISGLILLTHKMTSQLFCFLCVCAAASWVNIRFLALIPGSVIIALILSKGYYINIVRAHWDIVTFWNRNWRWLSANAVKESPIYGEPGYETPGKIHKSGIGGFLKRLTFILGFYPAVWVLFITMYLTLVPKTDPASLSWWLLMWITFVMFFAIITTFVPFLKCLGVGYLYIYNATFPAALLCGILVQRGEYPMIIWIGLVTALVINMAGIHIYYKKLAESKTQKISEGFRHALDYLKSAPPGIVWGMPTHLNEPVAYITRLPVLWGAHGYGFRLLEPVFPRILVTVSEIRKKYDVKYVLTIDGYLTEKFKKDLDIVQELAFDEYRLYVLS